ncbi:MAG: hypothetical protein LAT61_08095 [Alcanivorax sp.]|nr:hypothetical protein [Alcanivorax sp.]
MKTKPAAASMFWLVLLLATSLSLKAHALTDDGPDDEMDEVTPEELSYIDIPVDERIFKVRWNEVPYNKRFFDYSPAEIEARWDEFMVGVRAPFPSPGYLEYMGSNHPEILENVENFRGYDDLSRRLVHVWRLFLRGDFQQAREDGLKLGIMGLYPAMFSQITYAIYLADRQTEKYMMLQDAANRIREHIYLIDRLEDDPIASELVAFTKLGHAYAIARIAEESPVPIIVVRGYIGLIKDNAEEIIELEPDHPLGHAFRAAVDANIMRRVGRATGRMTYGARSVVVDESFAKAFEMAPDIPILNYEYANAIMYMSRKRDLNQAIDYLTRATRYTPTWSMDALDTMYAFKRLQEAHLYDQHYRSFRAFERHRRRFSRVTDHNLTNVLSPPLNRDMMEHPQNYALPEVK